MRTPVALYRIDAATNKVVATIGGLPTLGTFFEQVATGEGAVWTSNIGDATVSRIDPATNKPVAKIRIWPSNSGCSGDPSTTCPAPDGITTTAGAVWVVLHREWKVVRIDPTMNKVVATISIGSSSDPTGSEGIASADGYVYVNGGSPSSPYLERIDPADNSVTPVLALSGFACDFKAATGNHVWVATHGCDGNSIDEVDATTKSIVGHTPLGAPMFDVSIGLGSVWAIAGNDLVQIDPSTHAVTGRLSPPPASMPWVVAGEGALWLPCNGFVYRLAP